MVEHIPFTTVKEDYNDYLVENGQILRVKYMLVDIVEKVVDGKIHGQLGHKESSYVISPDNLDTSGMEVADLKSVTDKDRVREVSFKPIKEVINIYETTTNIILLSNPVNVIYLTNKKTKENNPILRYKADLLTYLIDKSALSKRENTPEESNTHQT
ncbi:hypothetical protein [Nitrososphaera sp.]|uniref:hypothetical protein n=1 Tax=Nitrososphaera sp. TaxID=1971748 RepID=UPI0031812F03